MVKIDIEKLTNNDTMTSALVIKLQRYSIHDGPGIRTTVFLKGCPLECQWCSNPESQDLKPQLLFDKKLCDGCYRCIQVCTNGAITKNDKMPLFDRERCNSCGKCFEVCNRLALSIAGKEMTADEIINELLKDKIFFGENGGVTISGGEPMIYPELLIKVAMAMQQNGINIILDTSGCVKWEAFKYVAPHFDAIYYDVKHMDPRMHKLYTGMDNYQILNNLKRVSNMGIPVALRFPMIPGINDDEQNLRAMVDFVKKLNQYIGIYVLPYHNLGISKYEMLDKVYLQKQIVPPTNEQIDRVIDFFRKEGINVNR